MSNKDVVKRLRQLRAEGYDFSLQNGHYRVWPTDGRVEELKAEDFDWGDSPKFVVLGSTPSDHRSMKNLEKNLRRIGVGVGPSKKERRMAEKSRMKLEDSDARILEVLANEGRQGLTVLEICTLLDWPYGRVYPRLNALRKEGKLSRGWWRIPVTTGGRSSAAEGRVRDQVVWLDAALVKKGCFGSSGSGELTSFPEKVKAESLLAAQKLLLPAEPKKSASFGMSSAPPAPKLDFSGPTGMFEVNPAVPKREAVSNSQSVEDARELIRMFLDLPMSVLVAPELRRDLSDLRRVLGPDLS